MHRNFGNSSVSSIVFDTFGTRRGEQFVPAHYMGVITVTPGRQDRLEVAKRGISTEGKNIRIGAVNYQSGKCYAPHLRKKRPDSSLNRLASQEVRVVKSVGITWKCARHPQTGELVGVHFDRDNKTWRDDSGNQFAHKDIHRMYYDSQLWKENVQAYRVGEQLSVPKAYMDWMARQQYMVDGSGGEQHTKVLSNILDVGVPTGMDMVEIITNVHFNSAVVPIGDTPVLPEFYVIPRNGTEDIPFNNARISERILQAANLPDMATPIFDIEMPSYDSALVTNVERDQTSGELRIYVRDYKLTHNGTEPEFNAVSDELRVITIPDPKGVVEITAPVVTDDTDGAKIGEYMINRFDPLFRLIPYGPYHTIDDVKSALGVDLYNFVRSEVLDQLCPEISGRQAVALSAVDYEQVPDDVRVYVRNRPIILKLQGDPNLLANTLDADEMTPVWFDFINHIWFDRSEARAKQTGGLAPKKHSSGARSAQTALLMGSGLKEISKVVSEAEKSEDTESVEVETEDSPVWLSDEAEAQTTESVEN